MKSAQVPLLALRDRFLGGQQFEDMLASAEKNAELWAAVWKRAEVPATFVDRVSALGGAWHLLVLSADWCGDAVNTLPAIARLAALSSNMDLRILERDSNLDLMDAHLTGTSRSIPAVIVLDANYVERGWWGPRPVPLQQWVLGEGQGLEKTDRYKHVRGWYARDRALTTLEELVSLMERAAASISAGAQTSV
ncbi:MAG: thioredoxin family protein [Gemmatimonadota bacterium]|nr:thioredoxin family protein [Gemmatimonadota bacterium]